MFSPFSPMIMQNVHIYPFDFLLEYFQLLDLF
nr:MAG TPA: hypothetical protein [Caudoviricetes sp.]